MVGDLDRSVTVVDHGGDDWRAGRVHGLRAVPRSEARLHPDGAAVGRVEEREQRGRSVEGSRTPPVDGGIGVDEGDGLPVADGTVVPQHHPLIETSSTRSLPRGASNSTMSPTWCPSSAEPRGDDGDITSSPSRRSSMEPNR